MDFSGKAGPFELDRIILFKLLQALLMDNILQEKSIFELNN